VDERPDTELTAEEEAEIRELLESAGRRPAVPAADFAAIQAAARSEWQALARRRKYRFHRSLALALAASLLLALALGWWGRTGARPPLAAPVATVELTKGDTAREGAPGPLAAGDVLAAGTVLVTGGDASPGRAALRLASGESVRLDAGSRVRFVSASRLDLEAGAVYVDSPGRTPHGRGPEIRTPFGSVREIGTQFEVRLEAGPDPALRIRVREGAVSLGRRGGTEAVAAGRELRLRSDGSVSRSTIAVTGPDWDWVMAAAPSLAIDGATLGEYLAWVSRETGRRVRYAEPALVGRATATRLHGSIEGLTPDESLLVVLPGSGLAHRLEGDVLLIRTGS
jgi:hypothetical protein